MVELDLERTGGYVTDSVGKQSLWIEERSNTSTIDIPEALMSFEGDQWQWNLDDRYVERRP
jgi:hypothetical protein